MCSREIAYRQKHPPWDRIYPCGCQASVRCPIFCPSLDLWVWLCSISVAIFATIVCVFPVPALARTIRFPGVSTICCCTGVKFILLSPLNTQSCNGQKLSCNQRPLLLLPGQPCGSAWLFANMQQDQMYPGIHINYHARPRLSHFPNQLQKGKFHNLHEYHQELPCFRRIGFFYLQYYHLDMIE